jgi:hypothetical protein
MARRSNGGIIGKYNPLSGTSAGGVFSVNEAAAYTAVGQFPTGLTANIAPPLVEQTGSVLKPTITSFIYADNNYQEASLGANSATLAGTSLRIYGQNFFPNTKIYVNGNVVNTTNKYVNSGEIRTANISLPAGAYTLMAFNTSNVGTIYAPGIQFRGVPVWITNPTLASANVNTNFSYTLSSSDATAVVYSLASGSTLPANTALSSTGIFSGNVADADYGTYSFTVNLTNAYGLIVPRTFTIRFTTVYSATYLAVAGGGGGGGAIITGPGSTVSSNGSGGGGAGGLLEGTRTLAQGITYTVLVGAGGATRNTPTGPTAFGLTGGVSSMTATGFSLSASGGGGGGGTYLAATPTVPTTAPGGPGQAGGSGGGGAFGGGTAGLATGSPGQGVAGTQGYPGGNGGSYPITPGSGASSAGGGGAGGAGANGVNLFPAPGNFGAGGRGIYSSITGANVGYAGGGSYGTGPGSSASGPTTFGAFPAPRTNSGSGGGSQRAGESGIVVLRMPTLYYNGATFGSGGNVTVTTDGANTVLQFTGSSTFTP